MSNPDDPIKIALRDLADQAAPPHIRADDAWRAGRRRRRSRRQIPAVAAALTAVAGTALTVTSLAATGHPAPIQLAAWTVTTQPRGQISVTIRELRDPAGLQRRLRADGVPATIRFTSQFPRPCQYYRLPARQIFLLLSRIFPENTSASGHTAFTINPPAIPARIGLWINISPPARHGPGRAAFSASWTLVNASGRCQPGKSTSASGGGAAGGPSRK
jgi:hypothetical protein